MGQKAMTEELVTVIIPVYQAERFLDRCLASLLNQTYENLEILLIDDGSADGSMDKCLVWQEKDRRIKVLHHDNRGVGFTRNRGIEQAKGEFICFLDADDCLEHDAIACLQEEIEQKDADLCLCGYATVFSQKTVMYVPVCLGVMTKEELLQTSFWQLYDAHILHNIGTKLYRKCILMDYKIRFREEQRIFEDIMFCLEYLQAAKTVTVTGRSLYRYMQDNVNSVTKGYKEGYLYSAYALNDLLSNIIRDRNTDFFRNVIVNVYEAYINEFMRVQIDRKRIFSQSKELCFRSEVLSSRYKVPLRKLKIDARLFCLFVWHKCYVGLHGLGIWKRLRRRGKYNYEKTTEILLENKAKDSGKKSVS
ncbi:glycosyltransferase family A protein [Lachnospiraceae bacterium JLR.KK008]